MVQLCKSYQLFYFVFSFFSLPVSLLLFFLSFHAFDVFFCSCKWSLCLFLTSHSLLLTSPTPVNLVLCFLLMMSTLSSFTLSLAPAMGTPTTFPVSPFSPQHEAFLGNIEKHCFLYLLLLYFSLLYLHM